MNEVNVLIIFVHTDDDGDDVMMSNEVLLTCLVQFATRTIPDREEMK
jgi:hypothetical protein